MKEKNKIAVKTANDNCQDAINAMAYQVYLAKQASKARATEFAKFECVVDEDDAPFIDGVPFEFEQDDCVVIGKLKLRNQRVWDVTDIIRERK